jgi:UDP-glucose 4-epimerase
LVAAIGYTRLLQLQGRTTLKTVFVTGGGGYISTHTCVELLRAGYGVVVVDSVRAEALNRVEKITYKDLWCVKADVRDQDALDRIFKDFSIDFVIHSAGLNSIPASVANPKLYTDVNLGGTVALCDVMEQHGVRDIVFTSSAAVYGVDSDKPIAETADTTPSTPYGEAKLAAENHLRELCEAASWNAVALRCFNPAGAHPSGQIGEDPKGGVGSITPCIARVATGKRNKFMICGRDYNTGDGTAVRDYVHVVDLARGHVKALDLLGKKCGFKAFNLGTGKGHSVLEVLRTFEEVMGKKIPYEFKAAREGDLGQYIANPDLAATELDWRPEYGLEDMVRDAWNWQQKNPDGYRG